MVARAGNEHIWLQGTSVFACLVTGASCRHTYSAGDQDRQQGPGPTACSLVAAEILAVDMLSHGFTISPIPMCTAVDSGGESQAKNAQVSS